MTKKPCRVRAAGAPQSSTLTVNQSLPSPSPDPLPESALTKSLGSPEQSRLRPAPFPQRRDFHGVSPKRQTDFAPRRSSQLDLESRILQSRFQCFHCRPTGVARIHGPSVARNARDQIPSSPPVFETRESIVRICLRASETPILRRALWQFA
jgi:hypothetical protein